MPRLSSCARFDLEREAIRSTSSAVKLTSFSSCSGESDSQSRAAKGTASLRDNAPGIQNMSRQVDLLVSCSGESDSQSCAAEASASLKDVAAVLDATIEGIEFCAVPGSSKLATAGPQHAVLRKVCIQHRSRLHAQFSFSDLLLPGQSDDFQECMAAHLYQSLWRCARLLPLWQPGCCWGALPCSPLPHAQYHAQQRLQSCALLASRAQTPPETSQRSCAVPPCSTARRSHMSWKYGLKGQFP